MALGYRPRMRKSLLRPIADSRQPLSPPQADGATFVSSMRRPGLSPDAIGAQPQPPDSSPSAYLLEIDCRRDEIVAFHGARDDRLSGS